jgi:putative nucleotidyltransferase with HDIG domain
MIVRQQGKTIQRVFVLLGVIFLFAMPQSKALLDEKQANQLFNEFVELYQLYGGEKYMIDEQIIQRSHVLQAAYIAEKAGAPDEIVTGLLFHDVGQIVDADKVGDAQSLHYDHDELGAVWLKKQGFPENVWKLVRYHTLAKVELCALNNDYYDKLSKASQISYHVQKSKYEQAKEKHHVTMFRESPTYADYLAARKCDDMAKLEHFDTSEDAPNGQLPNFENYREQVVRVLTGKAKPARDLQWKNNIEASYQLMISDPVSFAEKLKG